MIAIEIVLPQVHRIPSISTYDIDSVISKFAEKYKGLCDKSVALHEKGVYLFTIDRVRKFREIVSQMKSMGAYDPKEAASQEQELQVIVKAEAAKLGKILDSLALANSLMIEICNTLGPYDEVPLSGLLPRSNYAHGIYRVSPFKK